MCFDGDIIMLGYLTHEAAVSLMAVSGYLWITVWLFPYCMARSFEGQNFWGFMDFCGFLKTLLLNYL